MFTQNRYRVYVTGRTNMDQHTKPNPNRLGKQADYYYLSETRDPNRTEPRPRPRYDHHTSRAPESEPFTPLLTRMHKLISRILSATFSKWSAPTSNNPFIFFYFDFWMRYLFYCLYVGFIRSVFSFFVLFFHVFLLRFVWGFWVYSSVCFDFALFLSNLIHSNQIVDAKEMRRHLNNNNHCTCWTFYATLALAHQQWTQHHH